MQNCWEFMKCGKDDVRKNIKSCDLCPAASEKKYNGLNHGKNGGRVCWYVTGTLCTGVSQITFASKFSKCLDCDFYIKVLEEEGVNAVADEKVFKLINE